MLLVVSELNAPPKIVDGQYFGARFFLVPKGNEGEYDSTEIHDKGMLRKHITGVSLHLAWQMIGFFMFLYW
jgi:hypothetical protein